MSLDEPGRKYWFRHGNRNEVDGETLKPLLEACEESDVFQRRIDAWLEERQLKSHVKKTKREVKAQIYKEIEGLDLDELKETTNNVLGEGLFRKSKWSKDRIEGARGVNTRFQNFSTKMAGFFEANEVILELVKVAGEPYATAAYGAMSLLFIVVSNKVNNDTIIATAIEDMTKAFPRSTVMSDIYPEQNVERLVAEVFRAVIRFAINAVDYYTSTGMRFINAAKPAKLGLDQSVENLHKLLAELNAECSVLLHKNIVRLVAMNKELQAKVDKLNRHNENMLEREDRERLEETRRILYSNPDAPSTRMHTDIAQLRRNVNRAFSSTLSTWKIGYHYFRMTPSRLAAEKSYSDWWSCDHSALLVLAGKTQEDSRSGPNGISWLSAAPFFVHDDIREPRRCTIYWTFYPELWRLDDDCHVHDAFVSLIHQILRWKPSLLRERYTVFKQLLNQEEWKQHDPVKALDKMFKALTETLARIGHEETVYLILDRCDQCFLKESFSLRRFVTLVQNLAFKVKIMLTYEATFCADLTPMRFKELVEEAPGRIYGKINFDQERESVL